MAKRLKRLPFSVYEIKAINWVPGSFVCDISYAGVLDGVLHTSQFSVDDLDTACPTFERCLHCAVIMAEHAPPQDQPRAIAHYIQCWSSWFFRKQADACVIFEGHGGVQWLEIASITAAAASKRRAPSLRVEMIDPGVGVFVEARLLDANYPGFTALQKLLIFDLQMAERQALELLRMLAQALPHRTLKRSAQVFVENLTTCVPLGLTNTDLLRVLTESANQTPASGVALPVLSCESFA